MSTEWDWELTTRAKRQFRGLDAHAQDRIADKLDAIVNDEWRDPDDYLEPLQGAAHQKCTVGQYRLGCRLDRETATLYVLAIAKRGGDAYRGDDD